MVAAAMLAWSVVVLLQLELSQPRMRLWILTFPVLGFAWLVVTSRTVVAFYLLNRTCSDTAVD